jgi:hypothetical protein
MNVLYTRGVSRVNRKKHAGTIFLMPGKWLAGGVTILLVSVKWFNAPGIPDGSDVKQSLSCEPFSWCRGNGLDGRKLTRGLEWVRLTC